MLLDLTQLLKETADGGLVILVHIFCKAKAVSIMYTYICFSSIIDWVLKFYFNIRVFPAVLSHSLFYKIEPLQEANLEWHGGIMYALCMGEK